MDKRAAPQQREERPLPPKAQISEAARQLAKPCATSEALGAGKRTVCSAPNTTVQTWLQRVHTEKQLEAKERDAAFAKVRGRFLGRGGHAQGQC